jgi:hypothetical protein
MAAQQAPVPNTEMTRGRKAAMGAAASTGHHVGQATPSAVKSGAQAGAAYGPEGAAAGAVVGVPVQMFKGAKNIGGDVASNKGGVVAIMVAVFAIVALAKLRGTSANAKAISTPAALFGGFVALFLLTGLEKINPRLGTLFAILVLVGALFEYGQDAFTGLFSNTVILPGTSSTSGTATANSSSSSTPPNALQQAATAASNTAKIGALNAGIPVATTPSGLWNTITSIGSSIKNIF